MSTMIGDNMRKAFPPAATEMSEGEALARAREAYCDVRKPWRWLARRIRAGKCDKRLRAIVHALRQAHLPMQLIEAERDEATVALILRTTPGLEVNDAVVAAIVTGVRMGRRG
jgi:hypothetical protein